MIDLSNSICLGTITKTHGIKGQVVLRLDHYGFDDILRLEPVFIEIDGLPVPFFVEAYEEKTTDSLILFFEDMRSKPRDFIRSISEFLGLKPVFDEETFGPVAAVIRIINDKQAIKLGNDTEYGLGSSIWSGNIDRVDDIIFVIVSLILKFPNSR